MVNLIPNIVRETWGVWNIRGLVLVSLTLQVFLLLFAPFRKRTNASIVTWSLWSTYLLADYVATFCIGLIFNERENISAGSVNGYILAFWAPFLLLHLGGPDSITAFALEDNELWLRHLLGLVFQLVATVYLFFLTIPGNTLWIPTVLVFVAGSVKYIERTRSLFLASMSSFRKFSMALDKVSGVNINYATHMEQYFNGANQISRSTVHHGLIVFPDSHHRPSHVELLRQGFEYFNRFKGLIVDMTYGFYYDRNESRHFFRNISPEDALIVIEAELNFIYEFFFTKASVLWSKVGYLFRFVSFSSTIAALLVFNADKKHGFSKLEIRITYILLSGAVALDTVALLMLVFSDWTVVMCSGDYKEGSKKMITTLVNNFKATIGKVLLIPLLKFKKPKWSNCKKEPYTKFQSSSTSLLFRKWSGTLSGHDFIMYCLHKAKEGKQSTGGRSRVVVKFLKQTVHRFIECFGAEELVETWIYKANNPFLKELWEFIFSELQRKSEATQEENREIANKICQATGEWVLQEGEMEQKVIDGLIPFVNSDEFGSFGDRIMIWHIATNLCYYADAEADQEFVNANNSSTDYQDHRYFSTLLSDYMLYLIVMEPSVISTVAGIESKTIHDVKSNLVEACGVAIRTMENQNQKSCEQWVCEALINAFSSLQISDSVPNAQRALRKSFLIHASYLANQIRTLLPEKKKRWKIVAQIWVEMLSFAAINNRSEAYVQQLSKGGQLISLVWLLMFHMGLGTRQFQKNEIGIEFSRSSKASQPMHI